MDLVRTAFEGGAITLAAARVLAEAREAEPVAFESAEAMLIESAARRPIADLRRAVVVWRHLVASERAGGAGIDEVLRARRRLHATVALDGMVRLDGDLDPETGETFMTALRAVLDADARSHLAEGAAGTGATDDGRPHSAVLTRSQRSAGDGSIDPIVRRWPENVRTSMSRCRSRRSKEATCPHQGSGPHWPNSSTPHRSTTRACGGSRATHRSPASFSDQTPSRSRSADERR